MKVHDFKTALSASFEISKDPVWLAAYHHYFPTMTSSSLHEHDLTLQRQGIDRKVFLANGKTITIDEKYRTKDYGDIALEEWSVFEEGKKGWTENTEITVDYVAYLVTETRTMILLPVQQTQRAWTLFKEEWKEKYNKIVTQNKGYRTIGWGIPPRVLFGAIAFASFFAASLN